MGKTRVHLLAKELGIETKELIAQLDRLGMRGRKAQSALEDDEVARVRAALAAQEKPQVHVGEEKIVADRVVKSEEEGDGGAEARETVIERRVRANVIRRRVNRIEVAPSETLSTTAETIKAPITEPAPANMETAAPAAPVEDIPPEAPDIEAPGEWSEPVEVPEAETAPMEPDAIQTETAPAPEHSQPESHVAVKTPAPQEAPRGARILGRIDLKQTMRMEPAPTPVLRKPMPGAPSAPGGRTGDADRPRPADGAPAPAGDDKPKAGRHKKRVVKKQDVLETREKELRGGGRIPRKKRVLPGKEIRRSSGYGHRDFNCIGIRSPGGKRRLRCGQRARDRASSRRSGNGIAAALTGGDDHGPR